MKKNDFFADIAMTQHPINNEDKENPPRVFEDKWYEETDEIFPYEKTESKEIFLADNYTEEQRYERFLKQLEELRTYYKPFLTNNLPALHEAKTEELKHFKFRYAKKGEIFMQMENIDSVWEEVTIPDYRGPEGRWKGYYKTSFKVDDFVKENERIIIRLESVDYKAIVYVNENYVGSHEGFFAPFEFDITDYVSDENELIIEVNNDLTTKGDDGPIRDGDKIYAATGPGWDDPKDGWHHCPAGAGIIGKVLLERRPDIFIDDIFVRPNIDDKSVELRLGVMNYTDDFPENFDFELTVLPKNFDGKEKVEFSALMKVIGAGKNEYRYHVPMEEFKLWDFQTPYLYNAICTIKKYGKIITQRARHFGMRKFVSDETTFPKGKFFFNNKPIILRGADEMGHLQQDVMNDDYDQLIDDILIAKICNMNYYRLTQRPVQEEIYNYMDMLGMMTQTDLPLFSTLRRNQAMEAVKQAGEMEHLLRSHPSAVIVTFINEPVCIRPTSDPNSKFSKRYALKGHRHLYREELEAFFEASRKMIYIENPDRVIKNVEGDYDPPTGEGMPDFHSYTMWYSHHPIPVARLAKGYIPPVKAGWMIGCGEYGAEGLDNVELLKERCPKEWLELNENGEWYPTAITRAQTNAMHGDWYSEQTTMHDWVKASQIHQAEATKIMTEAFRRRSDYIGHTAIHLLIDAWPTGWMKTLVSCDRRPKLAFYAYEDSLVPFRLNLYCDRSYIYSNERIPVEVWLLNDTQEDKCGRIVASVSVNGKVYDSYASEVSVDAAYSTCSGKISMCVPQVSEETIVSLDAVLYDNEGNAVNTESMKFIAYPKKENSGVKVSVIGAKARQTALQLGCDVVDITKSDSVIVSDVDENGKQIEKLLSDGKNVVVVTPDVEQVKFTVGEFDIETKKGPKVYFAAQSDKIKDYHFNRMYSQTSDYREFIGRKYILGDEGQELVYTYGKTGKGEAAAPKVHYPLVNKYKVDNANMYVLSLVLDGKIGFNPNLDEFLIDCIKGNI